MENRGNQNEGYILICMVGICQVCFALLGFAVAVGRPAFGYSWTRAGPWLSS